MNNLRFCLKAVCIYECLSGKPYPSIDFADVEELNTLLYAMYLSVQGNPPHTQEQFVSALGGEVLRNKVVKEAVQRLRVEQALQSKLRLEGSEEPSEAKEGEASEPQALSPTIATLIIEGGMSADYVLYEMGLWELPMYLKALERRRLEAMERERLWCYLGLSPHIDHDKIRSPKDLLPLPHERKAEAEEEAAQDDFYKMLIGDVGK